MDFLDRIRHIKSNQITSNQIKMQMLKVLVFMLLMLSIDARRPIYRSKAKAQRLRVRAHAKRECILYNKPSLEFCEQKFSNLTMSKEAAHKQQLVDFTMVIPVFIMGFIGLLRNI